MIDRTLALTYLASLPDRYLARRQGDAADLQVYEFWGLPRGSSWELSSESPIFRHYALPQSSVSPIYASSCSNNQSGIADEAGQ